MDFKEAKYQKKLLRLNGQRFSHNINNIQIKLFLKSNQRGHRSRVLEVRDTSSRVESTEGINMSSSLHLDHLKTH